MGERKEAMRRQRRLADAQAAEAAAAMEQKLLDFAEREAAMHKRVAELEALCRRLGSSDGTADNVPAGAKLPAAPAEDSTKGGDKVMDVVAADVAADVATGDLLGGMDAVSTGDLLGGMDDVATGDLLGGMDDVAIGGSSATSAAPSVATVTPLVEDWPGG